MDLMSEAANDDKIDLNQQKMVEKIICEVIKNDLVNADCTLQMGTL
jgi:hypothetical protein